MVGEALADHRIETRVVDVVDGNSIDREISRNKPTHVVLEAFWCPPYKVAELARLYPRVKFTVRDHSKTPFLAGEGIAFGWAFDYAKTVTTPNYILSANSPQAVREFNWVGLPCAYTPNFYTGTAAPALSLPCHGVLNIGCFGAIRLLKNHMIQAIAAIRVANELGLQLRFHINVARQEMQGTEPLKNLRSLFSNLSPHHQLVEHEWLSHDDFMQLVRTMHAGLQVSYTETFNIVAADFVYSGVPIVVSEEIDWMPRYAMADPNDSEDIARKLHEVLLRHHGKAQREAIEALEEYNRNSLHAWLDFLKK
jgi:hypothetical protein